MKQTHAWSYRAAIFLALSVICEVVTGQSFPQFDRGGSPTRGRASLRSGKVIVSPRTPRVRPAGLSSTMRTRHLVPEEYPTIQAAIDASSDGDTVLVSEGTYFENIRYWGKAIVVGSHYLLDGDTAHISRTILDGSRFSNPDSGSVVYLVDGEDTTSILAGCTVRGGRGTSALFLITDDADTLKVDSVWSRQGGGVWIDRSAACLVRNIIHLNRIAGRTASGGGIAAFGGGLVILKENRITDNIASGDSVEGWVGGYSGGADFWISPARIVGNVFDRDTAVSCVFACGGAMFFWPTENPDSSFTTVVEGNLFRKNLAHTRDVRVGGAAWAGACYAKGEGRFEFCNNLFLRNAAISTGPTHGGAMLLEEVRAVLMANQFVENSSLAANGWDGGGNGGAIESINSNIRIEGNSFIRNTGISKDPAYGDGGAGGALAMGSPSPYGGDVVVANNIFAENVTGWGGGAIGSWFTSALPPVRVIIVNNTIVGNRATRMGGGIFLAAPGDRLIMNNILWGNLIGSYPPFLSDQISSYDGGEPRYYHNVVQGGWGEGVENIDADPGFEPGSYSLSAGSPCIGAGIDSVRLDNVWVNAPRTDLARSSRPLPGGSWPDIGALEHPLAIGSNQPALSPSPRFYDFRNVQPGATSDTLTLTIRNRGMAQRDLLSFSLSTGTYRFAPDPVPTRLRGIQSIKYQILFSPAEEGKCITDTLRIEIEDEIQPQLTIPLAGRGSAAPRPAGGGMLFGLSAPPGGPGLHVINKTTGIAESIGGFSPSPPPFCSAIAIRSRDSILYAASPSLAGTDLYRLSSEFGDLDQACTIPLADVTSMAFSRADFLYIVTGDGRLYRGSIGSTDTLFLGLVGRPLTGLAFSPATGVLWGSHHDSLFTIDTQNGTVTLQGVNDWNAPHSSITFNGVGTMYGLYGNFLVSIDKGTGMPRYIGETKVPDLQWIAMRSDIVTGMEEEESIPGPVWELAQNYPNPFNAGTVIRYQLPAEAHATLTVYDILGREVITLVDEPQRAGEHTVRFDGSPLASGVYIYRLTSGAYVQSRKMILMK